MLEEKKTVELKDEELEKVAGGDIVSDLKPQPPSGLGTPSCYYNWGTPMNNTHSIKASCAGCDYIENCVNKYIIK